MASLLNPLELNNPPPARPRLRVGLARIPMAIGALAGVAGLLALADWQWNLAGWPKMMPATAVMFILAGASLCSLVSPAPRPAQALRFSRGLAAMLVLAALGRCGGFLLGGHANFDRLWLSEHAPQLPSEMSLMTAPGLLFLGAALLLAGSRKGIALFQFLLFATAIIGWLGLSPYLLGGEPPPAFALMAFSTAFLLIALSAGVFCTRTDGGLMALLISDTAGGLTARRLLLPTLFVPVAMNCTEALIERLQWFGPETNSTLFTISDVAIFGGLAWFNARLLHRTDLKRKRTEESLRLFRLLIDQSNDGIEVVDAVSGRLLDINETTCRRLGYRREELLAMAISDLNPDAVTAESWRKHLEAMREAKARIIEGTHRRKDGSSFPVEVNVRYVRTDRELFISVVRDISERKQAEEREQKSQAQLRLLIEQAPVSIAMLDRQLRYLIASRRWISEHGQGQPVLNGRSYYDIIPDLPEHWKKIHERCLAGEFYQGDEEQWARADGRVCWQRRTVHPWRDPASQIGGIIIFTEDVTERKKMEEEFRQAQKMETMGQLAGGVAHDFNNLLMVIQMQSELLKDGRLDDQQTETVREITDAVERAAALTRQLLLFSRRQASQPQEIDLNESITNIMKMLKRIVGETVQIELKLAAKPMMIHADPGMIDQVLMNLVVNARDAMAKGGQLRLETTAVCYDGHSPLPSYQARPGSFVRLRVTDTGCGIPPAILPKIFEPFFTTKGIGKGTGLGLATVFGIVQQHAGWIDVTSQVSQGTTFEIHLPQWEPTRPATAAGHAKNFPTRGSETILLVEDDARVRLSVQQALSALGYRILEATNAIHALDVWHQHRGAVQVLLTDLVMPDGMTGTELAARLRQEDPQLKIIYMSGYSPEVFGSDLTLKEGAKLLIKPFKTPELARTIRQSLDRTELN